MGRIAQVSWAEAVAPHNRVTAKATIIHVIWARVLCIFFLASLQVRSNLRAQTIKHDLCQDQGVMVISTP
jgi:hypothetical protein